MSGPDMNVVPAGMETVNTIQQGAATMISAAGTVDAQAMMMSVASAIGPIGAAPYFAPYAMAQSSNLAATLLTAAVHAGIGAATEASKVGYIATDSV